MQQIVIQLKKIHVSFSTTSLSCYIFLLFMTSRSFLKRIQLTSKRKFYTLVYSLYENRMSLCLFFNMFASKKNPKNKKKIKKTEAENCREYTLRTLYTVIYTLYCSVHLFNIYQFLLLLYLCECECACAKHTQQQTKEKKR